MFASENGHGKIAKELIHAVANIDCENLCGWTSLIISAVANHLEIVDLLMDLKHVNNEEKKA